MITFIVTTYNLEDCLLRRCIESIVSQGLAHDEYEIIVVDDESDTSPQHVVNEFVRKADISLLVQKHARQGAARNLALQHARGEWIQFVDGDDYLFAHSIPPLLKLAQDNELDLLSFGFRKVYDITAIKEPADKQQPNSHNEAKASISITSGNDYMLSHNLFGSCCMQIFRRSILDDPKYGHPLRFTENIYIEDEEFITKLVWRAQRMAATNIPVYAYYQRPGSTVHSRSREHTDELFHNYFVVLKRLSDFEREVADKPHDGLTRKIRFFAVDILRRALREPDWRNRWKEAASQLQRLRLYPIPQANYSWKYRLFRLLTRNRTGQYILWHIEKRQEK